MPVKSIEKQFLAGMDGRATFAVIGRFARNLLSASAFALCVRVQRGSFSYVVPLVLCSRSGMNIAEPGLASQTSCRELRFPAMAYSMATAQRTRHSRRGDC